MVIPMADEQTPPADQDTESQPLQTNEPAEFTDFVKSRILNRVLAELAQDLRLGNLASLYTKSSIGVYGKYEKYDADVLGALKMIRGVLERMEAECQRADQRPDSADKGPDSNRT